MQFLTTAFAILQKDFLTELREKKRLNTILFFGVLIIFLFSFAFGTDPILLKKTAPGLLWLVVLFSSLFALEESFDQETKEGCLDRLVLYTPSLRAVFCGKWLANFIFIGLIQVIILFLMLVLFGLPMPQHPFGLAGTLFLANIGLAALGTFYSGLTCLIQARAVLLPLLLFPMLIPLLLGAVLATQHAWSGDLMGNLSVWLQLLAFFDGIFLAACLLVWPLVLET